MFRYEKWWNQEEECKKIMEDEWKKGKLANPRGPIDRLLQKYNGGLK